MSRFNATMAKDWTNLIQDDGVGGNEVVAKLCFYESSSVLKLVGCS